MKNKFKTVTILLMLLVMVGMLIGCGTPTEAEEEDAGLEQNQNTQVEKSEESNQAEDDIVEIVEAFAGAEFTMMDEDLIADIQEDVRTLKSIEEASLDGELLGYKILITPNGYGGPVEVFTYIDLEGEVLQVEIGEHGETTGVGDAVTNPKFLNKFVGVDSKETINAIDGVAGATFSSGATKDGITRALNVFNEHIK